MEKKIAGLVGAAAALGAMSGAQATPAPTPNDTLRASSFAELLEPIPNAASLLKTVDQTRPSEATVQLAQYYRYYHHHHHHHHHHFWRRYYHHHHHHHHHGYYRYY